MWERYLHAGNKDVSLGFHSQGGNNSLFLMVQRKSIAIHYNYNLEEIYKKKTRKLARVNCINPPILSTKDHLEPFQLFSLSPFQRVLNLRRRKIDQTDSRTLGAFSKHCTQPQTIEESQCKFTTAPKVFEAQRSRRLSSL